MVNTFHQNYLEKTTRIAVLLDSVLPMVKLIVKLSAKRKQKNLAKDTIKWIKWDDKDLNQYDFPEPKAGR